MSILKNQLFVAWLALGVTLAHAGTNALFYFRGSQVAMEAKTVLIYLQQGPGGTSLSAAVELVVTNGSPWYADALVGATGELVASTPMQVVRLPSYDAVVNPRFEARCPTEGRCLNLASLAIQFLDEEVKGIPTSGAQVVWVSFEIPCRPFGMECNPRDGFASMSAITGREWKFVVNADFVHEGEVSTSCLFGPVTQKHFDTVKKYRWTSFKCRRN